MKSMEAQHIHYPDVLVVADDPVGLIEAVLHAQITSIILDTSRFQARAG